MSWAVRDDHPPGLGRLGVISNESGWLIAKIPSEITDTRRHYLDVGFILHQAVIRLSQAEIGTVWVAGTFSSAAAEQSAPGFRVAVAVAYGEAGGKPSFITRVMRWFSTSSTRQPLEHLFFDGSNGRPFTDGNTRRPAQLAEGRPG
jgi:hypothetical protein